MNQIQNILNILNQKKINISNTALDNLKFLDIEWLNALGCEIKTNFNNFFLQVSLHYFKVWSNFIAIDFFTLDYNFKIKINKNHQPKYRFETNLS